MKRVFLLRHGKSDWNAGPGGDHERPLAARGVEAARLMGRFLTVTGREPDVVVSSSARRALTTAQLAHESGGWPGSVHVEPELYGATVDRAVEEIRSVADEADSVLLSGHEPTCSTLAGSLIGAAEVRFPTAAMACIEFPVSRWESVDLGGGILIFFVTPKLLKSVGFVG